MWGARTWAGGPALAFVAGVAAALPVAVSTVHAVAIGWQPTDDKGIIATRAYDVLTGHTPLVGQYSMASRVTGDVTHGLGPMLYWLVALPARFGDPPAMAVTVGAMNVVAILATVALARRRGGQPLMFATSVAIAVMSMSLAAESFRDIWNPAAALFVFLLLIFLCWSLACGDLRLLPLTVLAASFVAQAHLAYLLPAAGMLAVGLAGLSVTLIGGRRRRLTTPAQPWRVARWGLAAVAVGVACWLPAVIDQGSSADGNLAAVVQSATAPKRTLGTTIGAHAVVRAIGVPPWWLISPATRWDRYGDVLAAPSAGAVATTVALLCTLGLAAVTGVARRRMDIAAGAAIALVLCATLGAVAAQTPAAPSLASTVGYTLWWGSHCGMWVWLILAWAAWVALPRRRTRVRASAVGSVVGLAAAGVAGGVAAAGEAPDQHVALYRPLAEIAARLDGTLAPGATVRLNGALNGSTAPFKPAIRYYLARRGVRPLSVRADRRNGDWYELRHRPYDMVVTVTDRPRPPRGRVSLIARVGFVEHGLPHRVFVWLGHVPRSGG